MEKTRVVVLDDQMIARGYFEQAIEVSDRYEVVGSFGSADAAVKFCSVRAVDVVVLDIVMKRGMDGLDAATAIKAARPACKVVVVTSMPEAGFLARAREIGVEGFWYKEYADAPLLDVLDAVMDGRTVYPDAVPPVALGNAKGTDLTEAELAVLREMVTGASNVEIAERLGVSVHTVRTHVKHLLSKTGCASRTQLAVEASLSGLVVARG